MVRFENGFKILPMRPRPRGWKRFSTSALPTNASATISSSTSRSWLFSALAIADSKHFFTSVAIRFCENCRSASAIATFLPRMSWARRLSFCGDTRSMRATALASVSGRSLSRARLPMLVSLARRRRRSRRTLRLAVGGVAVERAGRRELAELMPDHLLGDVHRDMLLAVVDAERQADELRQDRRAAAPDLDHLVPARRARRIRLLQQIAVDKRAFPNRT